MKDIDTRILTGSSVPWPTFELECANFNCNQSCRVREQNSETIVQTTELPSWEKFSPTGRTKKSGWSWYNSAGMYTDAMHRSYQSLKVLVTKVLAGMRTRLTATVSWVAVCMAVTMSTFLSRSIISEWEKSKSSVCNFRPSGILAFAVESKAYKVTESNP